MVWYIMNQKIKHEHLLVIGLIFWLFAGGITGYLVRYLTEPGENTLQANLKQTALKDLLWTADLWKVLPDTDPEKIQVFVKAFQKGTRDYESPNSSIAHWPNGSVTPIFTMNIFVHQKDCILNLEAIVHVHNYDQFEYHVSFSKRLNSFHFRHLEDVCIPKIFWRLVRAGMIKL